MKSKSLNLKLNSDGFGKTKVLDFVGLYKSTSETNAILAENSKTADVHIHKNASTSKIKSETPKKESPHNKNRKKNKTELLDVSHININGANLNPNLHNTSPHTESRVTSTPNTSSSSKSKQNRVKSIMKNAENGDDSMDTVSVSFKSKKRNKSVSFMLEDNEDVVIKKTKSNDSLQVGKNNEKSLEKFKRKEKKFKKSKKDQHEKENIVSDVNDHVETVVGDIPVQDKNSKVAGDNTKNAVNKIDTVHTANTNIKKKKLKKGKVQKKEATTESTGTDKDTGDQPEASIKKPKKKKRKAKTLTDSTETDGEPALKSRKKDTKPDGIAEDLENLNIGDNPNTLTSLLDEMTVVDKDKRKKLRQKLNKKKSAKEKKSTKDTEEEGEEEKVKWKRRKWNKDRKGGLKAEDVATTVIVDNLPISTITAYKKLLGDHFQKFGLIKYIGVAEVSTDDSKPVFSTTISFYSDGAAEQALAEDTTIAGTTIHVRRPLPPSETTVVVRTYGDLTEQAVSSMFSSAGRIRTIRTLIKGKKSMNTAFVEFDGPESVARAIEMAADGKIGGKKIHVSKYDPGRKRKHPRTAVPVKTEDNSASEDSD